MRMSFKQQFLIDLQTLMSYPSVLSHPEEGIPYGKAIGQALEWFLQLGRSYGFTSVNVNQQAGYIEFGEGEEIGILGHLDVVPVGDGWTYGAFNPTIVDGKLIGRGINDDKGPTMAAFYAMRVIKEMNVPLKKKIRLILGTDEESGMRCIKHYLTKYAPPVMAFAPDATFPLIYAEKGIHSSQISGPEDQIISFTAGERLNMVPDIAKAVLTVDVKEAFTKYLLVNKLDGRIEGDTYILLGKAAHAMQPEEGINAAVELGKFLVQHIQTPFTQALSTIDTAGRAFGIDYRDDEMGPITFNVGVVRVEQGTFTIKVNARIPKDYPYMNKYQMALSQFGTYLELSHSPVHYVPQDSTLVQTLLHAYQSVTGDLESEPTTIGGGTYARMLPNAVAFGALLPGREDVAHRVNEYMYVEDLYTAVDIYTKALLDLAT
jgi:succinyl-diaminopimelate desuccinylase